MLYRVGRDFFQTHPRLTSGLLGAVSGLIPAAIRHGAAYRQTRRLLQKSQWWSREQLEAYQLARLRDTIEYAYARIPYYKDAFDRHGVRPEQLRSLDDIRRFPTMGKETLRDQFDRIVAPHMDRSRLMQFCTGGTTGSGVVMLFEEDYRNRGRAFLHRMWDTVGYHRHMLAAVLQHRGCPEELNDGFWYHDRVNNSVVMSPHRLSRETLPRYLEAIERHRPKLLIGYPSLVTLLATYAEEAGWNDCPFEMILLGSETLYDFQRKRLEGFFQAPVHIHYGHIESVALFHYCEHSERFHVQMEYGLNEFLKEDGSQAGPGEAGEIVGTSFENWSVPLIRYRTRDWAELGSEPCGCGRAFPIVDKIQGREGDFIRTPSGRTHAPIVIEVLMDELLLAGYSGLDDLQIVQEKLDEVVVRAVAGKRFEPRELEIFCDRLAQELDHDVRVRSELTDRIPRTGRQKKSLVVSHLSATGDDRASLSGDSTTG